MPESQRPSWLGPLDVVVAALTVIAGFVLVAIASSRIDRQAEAGAYRSIRAASVILLALMALNLVAPGSLDWVVVSIGLAWRAWLLIAVLPAIVVLLRPNDSGLSGDAG